MPIRKGEDWGSPGHLPVDTPVAGSDAEAAALFAADHRLVALSGGDLCRTLGGRGDIADRLGGEATICAIDVGVVRGDGIDELFVAHVVARGRWWHGAGLVAMNASTVGDLRLGPRAHPGDGLLDVTEGSLPWRQLIAARSRARTGDHLPHPDLRVRRELELQISFAAPRLVFADGRRIGRARDLSLSLLPAALQVAV